MISVVWQEQTILLVIISIIDSIMISFCNKEEIER